MPEHKEKFSISYIYLAFTVGFGFCLLLYSGVGLSCKKSFQPTPDFQKLTILEAEEKFDIEILHPTIRELQEHINRHGGLKGKFIKVDGWYETETTDGADWIRCQQESSKWDFMYAGDTK